jgi:hypothetical protein
MRIPYFQDDTIPGKIMEKIVSLVRGGEQLGTYDYVDVCINNKIGWQIKSTKQETPLTWKRAKIAGSAKLIEDSWKSAQAAQLLGDKIIEFCNESAAHSLEKYKLSEIGYLRLIMHPDGTATYFERLVSSRAKPDVFNKKDYSWEWSEQRKTGTKEQLAALKAIHKTTNKKVFAWHGQGENQLHFSGERAWWPQIDAPTRTGEIKFSNDNHAVRFKLPNAKVSWSSLTDFLNGAS